MEIILSIRGEGHSRVCSEFNLLNPNTPINNTYVAELLQRFKNKATVLSSAEEKDRVLKKKVFSQDDVDKVHHEIQEDCHTSVRRNALHTGLSLKTTHNILKDGHFHPYKMKVMQELKLTGDNNDLVRRKNMCLWLRQEIENDSDFLRKIMWTDEATFTLNGIVNRQNFRVWDDQNPYWHVGSKNQSAPKVCVWIGRIDVHLIGPYFFDGNVNGGNYLDMLENFVLPAIQNIGMPQFFQQDGAPPHFSISVRNWLNEVFPDRWLGRGGPREWAPRSPDLTPLDFLFGVI